MNECIRETNKICADYIVSGFRSIGKMKGLVYWIVVAALVLAEVVLGSWSADHFSMQGNVGMSILSFVFAVGVPLATIAYAVVLNDTCKKREKI